MGRIILKTLVADFETVTPNTEYYKIHNDTCVLLGNIQCLEDDEINVLGTNISTFFEYLIMSNESATIYFHNLSFDGNFIYKYLMGTGLQWFNELPKMKAGFTIFRSGNVIYNLKVNKGNGKKLLRFNFKCSLKLLSEGIASIGKCYGINKNLDDDGEDFLDIEPQDSINKYSPRMIEYIQNDCLIMKLALIDIKKNLSLIMDGFNDGYKYKKNITVNGVLTIGAISYKLMCYQAEKYGFKKFQFIDPNRCGEIKKGLKPNKTTYELGSNLFYGGGTDFNHTIQDKEVECVDGRSYDINSAHPDSMTGLLPYGDILDSPPVDSKYLEYYHITVKKAVTKSDQCGTLLNGNKRNKRIDKSDLFYQYRYVPELHNFECYYSAAEWDELQHGYTFKGVKIIARHYFKADYFLKDLVEKEYQFKSDYKRDGMLALSHTYKILLNASYGKFGTRDVFNNEFYFNNLDAFNDLKSTGHFHKKSKTKEVLYKVVSTKIEQEGYYVITAQPQASTRYYHKVIAATITANTRIKLGKGIRSVGAENGLYSDTDSCYYKGGEYALMDCDAGRLGAGDLEQRFKYFLIKRSKLYFVMDENKQVIKDKFAGVNSKGLKNNLSLVINSNGGDVLQNANLRTMETPSGIVLVKKDYTMNRTI